MAFVNLDIASGLRLPNATYAYAIAANGTTIQAFGADSSDNLILGEGTRRLRLYSSSSMDAYIGTTRVAYIANTLGPAVSLVLDGATGEIRMAGFSGVIVRCGANTPEGAITAPVGSLFLRTNGGAGTTLYVKESGTGNTGWVAK